MQINRPAKQKKQRWVSLLPWAIGFLIILGSMVMVGAITGYQSGKQYQAAVETNTTRLSLQEQFTLGVKDLEAGQYDVARQRFEYIISQDPSFPEVTEKLAEAMAVLYATATPTQLPSTITPTPTRDLRPVEEQYQEALALLANQQWTEGIDTLIALRKADPAYQVARVDGLLFISLRQRGVDKIWKEGNLEGGTYDLALAARFGPLDAQANSARQLARLYMIGSSFWEVHPEQAVYYFSQVAAAAPGLHDASGITAAQRYRESLIQYGDLLASKKDWCNAQAQYELALSMGADAALQATLEAVTLQCSPPSATPGATTETPTPTVTVPGPTAPAEWTATPTPTLPVPPVMTDTPTATQPAPPSETPTEVVVPPSETPTSPPPEATATFTQEVPTQQSSGLTPQDQTVGATWQLIVDLIQGYYES